MKKEILIVKNISHEGPGLLEDILKEYNIEYKLVDLSTENILPPIKNFSAVVILGGPDSANDENHKMKYELNFVKEVIKNRTPYLGICLGLQVLVKAAGGNVTKCTNREIGFIDQQENYFTIKLTSEGKNDPLFEGLENSFKVFHLHGETVELTKGMTLLAVGKFCKNQVVKVNENAYGIQCHFELTQDMFELWCKIDTDLLQLDYSKLNRDYMSIKGEYERIGKKILTNFLKLAGFSDHIKS